VALLGELDAHFLREFITESRENIEQAEAALLKLETDPSDLEAINVVFRAFHTMKGVATWLGLLRIAELSHHA
jgi:two-component system, chemotaxis family, sensor kinase CheA